MDQISENDSGIDSLRQNFSPFNHVRNTSYTETINETVDSNTVQQRFNEVKFYLLKKILFFFYFFLV